MGTIQGLGAFCFGGVVGWLTYFTMRHKKEHAIADIATVIGAVGGAAVLSLFPTEGNLFSWYAIGLAIGFFGYFLVFLIMIALDPQLTIWHALTGTDVGAVIMGERPSRPPVHED